MKIALVSASKRGEIDRLLTETADILRADGVALAGIVKQQKYAAEFDNGCDMEVLVLPDGPIIKITQALGKGSDACRLDPGAIATAVSTVETADLRKAQMFILNKFGPEEAAGRGFCAVIGAALELDIPVLVGVGAATRPAFDTFVDGLAHELTPNRDAIQEWCKAAIG